MGDRLAGPSKAGLHVITFEFDFGRGTKAKKRKGFWVERPAEAFVLDAGTCPTVWNQILTVPVSTVGGSPGSAELCPGFQVLRLSLPHSHKKLVWLVGCMQSTCAGSTGP